MHRVGGAGQQSTPVMIKLYLYATKTLLPTGLEVEVVATYQSANKEPRVAHHTVPLPLLLACRPKPAIKASQHKLTLDTLHPAISLTELFEDFLLSANEVNDGGDASGGGTASSMGFQLWSNR
jgi:hypothetical protein